MKKIEKQSNHWSEKRCVYTLFVYFFSSIQITPTIECISAIGKLSICLYNNQINFFWLQVRAGSPAQGVLLRGDVIVKIQEYDARDVRNIDAQTLFRSAATRIRVVIMRDSKLVVASNMQSDTQKSTSPSAVPPYRSDINLLQYNFNEAANLLPQSPFQAISDNGLTRPDSRISNFSPMPTRDHQQEMSEEIAAITSQVGT